MNESIATHYRLKLTPITPTVIGSDEKIDQSEYYTQQDRLYVVDIMEYLKDYPDMIAKFVKKVSSNKSKFSLDKDMPEIKGKEEYVKYSIKTNVGIRQQVSAFVKDSDGKVYIPGSSIKGAVRTALAFREAKKQVDNIAHKATSKIKKNKHIIDELIYRPQEPVENKNRKKDIHYDLLRFLAFSDSPSVSPENILEAFSIKIISGAEHGKSFKPLAIEAWCPEKSIEIEMSIAADNVLNRSLDNMKLMDKKKLLTKKYIQKALNNFAMAALRYDIDIIERLPNNEKLLPIAKWDDEMLKEINSAPENVAYISLGQGQGWHRITDGIVLKDQFSFGEFLKNNFSRRDKKTKKNLVARPPFPKSRRIVEYDGND
ncbi:type III-A CRISPR-associated RAMP protein Csm5, partial [bacterium]|nr:type III-A CRISPR-associated RAMP protein Csm5 [bacterium]